MTSSRRKKQFLRLSHYHKKGLATPVSTHGFYVVLLSKMQEHIMDCWAKRIPLVLSAIVVCPLSAPGHSKSCQAGKKE